VERYLARFEAIIIPIVQALVVLTIVITVWALGWLFVSEGLERVGGVHSVSELQPLVIRAFGGALLVLLGLELLESFRTFALEHQVRLELILVVATIAAGRHMILLDFEHANGLSLLGVAAVMLALTGGYALVRGLHRRQGEPKH
jgi:uncharacterized membrane protein (DUF373 family)